MANIPSPSRVAARRSRGHASSDLGVPNRLREQYPAGTIQYLGIFVAERGQGNIDKIYSNT